MDNRAKETIIVWVIVASLVTLACVGGVRMMHAATGAVAPMMNARTVAPIAGS